MSTNLMAYQMTEGLSQSFEADGAVTKHMAVIAGSADNQVSPPTAANDEPVGIAAPAAADGEDVDVRYWGPAIGIASAAITRGALVAIAGTTGKLAAIAPGTTTADLRVVGRAMQDAAADGDQFTVFLLNNPFVIV